jgi:tRNA G18 (ribose-2'-O)-methylase SpoU
VEKLSYWKILLILVKSMRKLPIEEIPRYDAESFASAPKTPLVGVLDNIRSRNNVGALFRTADAFALEALYVCGITPRPPHRDIRKTALGAEETVAWEEWPAITQALHHLKEQGYAVFALEHTDTSQNIEQYQPPPGGKVALILGHEVTGVQEEALALCDGALEIPQFGTKHSLNVSVAAGVAFYILTAKLQQV